MEDRTNLLATVEMARQALTNAEDALAVFDALPANNVYGTLESAEVKVENMLLHRAHEDCEGSHNCGAPAYTQEFIVAGVHYIGTLTVQYNRHDKTYYFIDEYEFTYAAA